MALNARPASLSAVWTAVPASLGNRGRVRPYKQKAERLKKRLKYSRDYNMVTFNVKLCKTWVSYRLVVQWIHKKNKHWRRTDSLWRVSFDGIHSWGRVGSIRGWSHRVVKHKVVPANCCQCVGAAVEPAHALDKVLVLPIPVPAKQE